ncbi:uncharacterized protein LOC142572355 isoform X2 [Dermacentor variabilis]|uniref:uncharacterized protein LOC142572355 isoform X2 n=1 Tax=Dermacentor variabilis TaxID=34621 RepID=UPI003F5B608E
MLHGIDQEHRFSTMFWNKTHFNSEAGYEVPASQRINEFVDEAHCCRLYNGRTDGRTKNTPFRAPNFCHELSQPLQARCSRSVASEQNLLSFLLWANCRSRMSYQAPFLAVNANIVSWRRRYAKPGKKTNSLSDVPWNFTACHRGRQRRCSAIA